jgi:hypothetical protein
MIERILARLCRGLGLLACHVGWHPPAVEVRKFAGYGRVHRRPGVTTVSGVRVLVHDVFSLDAPLVEDQCPRCRVRWVSTLVEGGGRAFSEIVVDLEELR